MKNPQKPTTLELNRSTRRIHSLPHLSLPVRISLMAVDLQNSQIEAMKILALYLQRVEERKIIRNKVSLPKNLKVVMEKRTNASEIFLNQYCRQIEFLQQIFKTNRRRSKYKIKLRGNKNITINWIYRAVLSNLWLTDSCLNNHQIRVKDKNLKLLWSLHQRQSNKKLWPPPKKVRDHRISKVHRWLVWEIIKKRAHRFCRRYLNSWNRDVRLRLIMFQPTYWLNR